MLVFYLTQALSMGILWSVRIGQYTELSMHWLVLTDQHALPSTMHDRVESIKANGREPKSGLGRVFNSKLGCFATCVISWYTQAHPHL
jgi:hypothetical protein